LIQNKEKVKIKQKIKNQIRVNLEKQQREDKYAK
jgi:hypothetical protein